MIGLEHRRELRVPVRGRLPQDSKELFGRSAGGHGRLVPGLAQVGGRGGHDAVVAVRPWSAYGAAAAPAEGGGGAIICPSSSSDSSIPSSSSDSSISSSSSLLNSSSSLSSRSLPSPKALGNDPHGFFPMALQSLVITPLTVQTLSFIYLQIINKPFIPAVA